MRERVRKMAYSMGAGGVVVATQEVTVGIALLAVAAGAIAVDERLTRSDLIPWGE